ncbi:MAG: hypothetical protein AABX47_08030 [Nanoarchaeota archaeon]
MDKLNLIPITAIMTLMLAACAAGAATENAPLIAGQRSYTFSLGIKNPFTWNKYVFTRSDLNRDNCNKAQGYYWCQAKSKCLKVAVEKCKLTSSGNWYDGTTSEAIANVKPLGPAVGFVDKPTGPVTGSPVTTTPLFGTTKTIIGSTVIKSTSGMGLFGKLQPPKHGTGRADYSNAATTGRRTWGGLPAQKAASQTVDSGLGRY